MTQQQTEQKSAVPVKSDGRAGALTRWDPFEIFDSLEDEMARFWRTPRRIGPWRFGGLMRGSAQPVQALAPWAPQVDVFEKNGNLVVKAEIPGVKKEDIQVDVEGNVVSLRAEAKQEKEEKKGEKVIYSERSYGMASRSFSLPTDVDEKGAKAEYKDGVLTLTLPKKADGGGKRITVA